MKKHLLIACIFVLNGLLTAQTITISGVYSDKKNNPLDNANVEYLIGGSNLVGSATTDENGNFEMQVEITSLLLHNKIFMHLAAPNPFTAHTSFTINIPSPGIVSIVSSSGKVVDVIKLKSSGIHRLSWGGKNKSGQKVASGTYILIVVGEKYKSSSRFIYHSTQAEGSGLRSVLLDNTRNKKSASNDIIRFTRDNTSLLELSFIMSSGDTTLGVVTGNPGPEVLDNLNDTLLTLYPSESWRLNPYFYNDDQNEYDYFGDPGFDIIADTILQYTISDTGNYATIVTATDSLDGNLQQDMEAMVQVQSTLLLPDFELNEDSQQDTLVEDLDVFKNPLLDAGLTYQLVSQSNPELINIVLSGTTLLIDSLQADGYGVSTIGIEATDGQYIDTIYTNVNVLAVADIYGTITDLFDSTFYIPAIISIDENNYIHNDTADANGNYYISLNNPVDTVCYYPVTIRHDDYTPYHAWITIEPLQRSGKKNRNMITQDYEMVSDTFDWELYNVAFRSRPAKGYIPGYGYSNCQWATPPDILLKSDSSLVDGQDLSAHIANMEDNIELVGPNFNPRDILIDNTLVVPDFGGVLENGELGINWDNSVGSGQLLIVYKNNTGPEIVRGLITFNYDYHPTEYDNHVYNEEIGSVFGAIWEPTFSNYSGSHLNSVFHQSAPMISVNTYTDRDVECGKVYLGRARVHYWNEDYAEDDEEGWDWELRPDLIEDYYPSGKKKTKSSGRILVSYTNEHGESVIETYGYFQTPSKIMKEWPEIFFKEEIQKRIKEERVEKNISRK